MRYRKKFWLQTHTGIRYPYWGLDNHIIDRSPRKWLRPLDRYPTDHPHDLTITGQEENKYYSELQQDYFVCNSTGYKSDGIFVDIGAAHPIVHNNTYILETDYNWRGISFELGILPKSNGICNFSDRESDNYVWGFRPGEKVKRHILTDDEHTPNNFYVDFWNQYRKTPIITGDVLQHDLLNIFKKYKFPKIIDYLSVDIEPPDSTFKALIKAIESGYQFNMITFETERDRTIDYEWPIEQLGNNEEKLYGNKVSRKYMKDNDYILVANHNPDIEDWYVHKSFYKEFVNRKSYFNRKGVIEDWKEHQKEDHIRKNPRRGKIE